MIVLIRILVILIDYKKLFFGGKPFLLSCEPRELREFRGKFGVVRWSENIGYIGPSDDINNGGDHDIFADGHITD